MKVSVYSISTRYWFVSMGEKGAVAPFMFLLDTLDVLGFCSRDSPWRSLNHMQVIAISINGVLMVGNKRITFFVVYGYTKVTLEVTSADRAVQGSDKLDICR